MTNSIAENANLPAASGEDPAGEGEKELTTKLKHRKRARAYYLRNRDRVREKARNAYYRKRDGQKEAAEKAEKPERTGISGIKNGGWGVLVLFLLLSFAVVMANKDKLAKWWSQRGPATQPGDQSSGNADGQQGQQDQAASPPGYHPFDIGEGRVIQVRNSAG